MRKFFRPLDLDYENYQTENDVLQIQERPLPIALFLRSLGLDEASWASVIAHGYQEVWFVNGLLRLVNRDYFQRAWMIQEPVLAKELLFFVGFMEISSKLLLEGIWIVSVMGKQAIGALHFRSGETGFLATPHILQTREYCLKG